MPAQFTEDQIAQLRGAFEGLRACPPARAARILERCTASTLEQLAASNIKFLSALAAAELRRRQAAVVAAGRAHTCHYPGYSGAGCPGCERS
jgi:hypothetical protein